MKVTGKSLRFLVAVLSAAALLIGCPLPFDYSGSGPGSSHTTDPSTPNISASVTVSYSEQGGATGTITNGGSLVSGSATTVTLSTTTANAIIYYTNDGSQITSFTTTNKINGSSGQFTIPRGTSAQTVDIHAVAIGPDMLPSQPVHATVTVTPYPILSVTCDKTSINEDGGTATFTVASSSASAADITVKLLTGGTYTAADLTGSLPAAGTTFSATLVHSTTTISLPITGVHNSANANPNVTLAIQPDPNTPPAYTVGVAASASVVIQNDSSHTVTYNGNGNTGGAAPTDSNYYLLGATVTVLGNTGGLTKTGLGFVGWNTQANGSGTAYGPGQTFAIGAANVILYAQWATAYTVTYNGNGNTSGTVPTDANYYLPNATVTVLGNSGNLLKTDYGFEGWNMAANGSGTAYGGGSTLTMGSANVTLYAQWNALQGLWDFSTDSLSSSIAGAPSWTVNGNVPFVSGSLSFPGSYYPVDDSVYAGVGGIINQNSFTLGLSFQLGDLNNRCIIAGGMGYRWIVIWVDPSGNLYVDLNNHTLSYRLFSVTAGVDHTLLVSVDTATLSIVAYLDGVRATASIPGPFTWNNAGPPFFDQTLTSSDYSTGRAFYGLWHWVYLDNGVLR